MGIFDAFRLKNNNTDAYHGPYLRFGSVEKSYWKGSAMILIKGPTSVALPPKLILRQYLNIPHADKVDELVSATLKPVVIEGILVEFLQGYSFYRFDLSIYIEEFYSKTVRYVIVPPCKSSNLDVSFLFQSHHKFEFYVAKDKCSRWGFYDSSSLNEHGCKLFLKQIREKSSPIHLLVGMGSSPFSISDDQNIPKYLQSWLDYGVRLGIDIHSIRKNKNQNEETINFIRSQFLNYPFTIDIEEQYFSYLFEQYINTFFMPDFIDLMSTIPHVSVLKYYDILLGYNCFPKELKEASVIKGIMSCQIRLYNLFHLHTPTAKNSCLDDYFFLKQLDSTTCIIYIEVPDFQNSDHDKLLRMQFWSRINDSIEKHHSKNQFSHLVILEPSPIIWPSLLLAESSLHKMKLIEKRPAIFKHLYSNIPFFRIIKSIFYKKESDCCNNFIDNRNNANRISELKFFVNWIQATSSKLTARISLFSTHSSLNGIGKFSTVFNTFNRDESENIELHDHRLCYNFVSSMSSFDLSKNNLVQLYNLSSRLYNYFLINKLNLLGVYLSRHHYDESVMKKIRKDMNMNDIEENMKSLSESQIQISDSNRFDFAIKYLLLHRDVTTFRQSILPFLFSYLSFDPYTYESYQPLFQSEDSRKVGMLNNFSSNAGWFEVASECHVEKNYLIVYYNENIGKNSLTTPSHTVIPPLLSMNSVETVGAYIDQSNSECLPNDDASFVTHENQDCFGFSFPFGK